MGTGACGVPLHVHVRHFLSRAMCRYGHFVSRYPWLFIMLPVLVFGSLGAGLMKMKDSVIADDVDMPHDSQSFQDQVTVQHLFPDRTADHYDALELNEDQIMGSLIFRARNNASVYDEDVITEIRDVIANVKANVTALVDGVTLKYHDLCGRRHNVCVVTGERLLAPQFDAMRSMGILTYPKWKIPTTGDIVDLSFALADSDTELKRVGVVRVTFKLRHDLKPQVFDWEEAFVGFMHTQEVNHSDLFFSASRSTSLEREDAFRADLFFVWWSLGLIALCTCVLAACGGDVVSTRALLVPMGVVSPALGMVGAMGVLSLCGVKVVGMVWITPILLLGMGLTDMSLLMTSWSSKLDRRDNEDVSQRVGSCLADVGPSITVTSLSLSVALSAAYTSSFPSVANFGLYAGVGMLFYYVSAMTLGVGCLAVHGHRVASSRHAVACITTSPRDQLRKAGKPLCVAVLCGGSVPKENYGDQGVLEKVPRLLLVKLTRSVIARVVVGVVFLAILTVSIYGVFSLKHGVELKTLVARSSYFYDYLVVDSEYFGFSFPVVFVMEEGVEYNQLTAKLMGELLNKAQQDSGIDEDFLRCWLTDFANSTYYNLTVEGENFPADVVGDFLRDSDTFVGDVILNDARDSILASRCYLFTRKNSDQEELTHLMLRMRSLADDARFPVFAYHPAFLNYDRKLAVLPTLFQALGIAVALLCGLFVAFFPDPVSAVVVVSNAVTTIIGTLGLVNFMGVSVSFVSMTHIIFNAGFAVYFSVHVSAAYLQSESSSRADRVADAVSRAAAPLFNGALCLVVGVLVLLAASSYSFTVLFKVTVLTLLLALFHAAFFTPTILSCIGCEKSQEEVDMDESLKAAMLKQQAAKPTSGTANSRGNAATQRSWENTGGSSIVGAASKTRPSQGSAMAGLKRNWPNYFKSANSAHSTGVPPVSVGNGTAQKRRNKEKNGGKQSVAGQSTTPAADYQSTYSLERSRHSLASDIYENVGHSVSGGSGGHRPRKPIPGSQSHRAASVSHYENWPWRSRGSKPGLYDAPLSLPPSRGPRGARRQRKPLVINADYINLRPIAMVGSAARKKVSSPKAEQKSTRDADAVKEPKTPRQNKSKESTQIEIVASLNRLDEACVDPTQQDRPTSLEGIHHVACTLSTNGVLGSTQAYVTENFRDIPS